MDDVGVVSYAGDGRYFLPVDSVLRHLDGGVIEVDGYGNCGEAENNVGEAENNVGAEE